MVLAVWYAIMCLWMVLEHQDVCDPRQSIQLHGHLNASKVYVHEIHWSGGHNWV